MTDSTIIKELVTKMVFRLDHKSLTAYTKKVTELKRSFKELEALARKTIKPKIDTRSFRVATNEVGRLRQGIAQVARSAGRGITLKMNVSGMGSIMQAQRAAQRATGSGGMLNVAGGNLISGAVTSAGAMAQQGGKFALDSFGQYQLAMTRLTNMVGKNNAGRVLKDIERFAAATPFELGDTLEMFTQLQNSGFGLMDRKSGKVNYSRLMAFGDIAATSNKSLSEFTQMALGMGRGRADMFDNFSSAGLQGAWAENGKISGTMGNVRTGKATEFTIDPRNKEMISRLLETQGRSGGVSGGMSSLSRTLPGQISTFWDTVRMSSNRFMISFESDIFQTMNRVIAYIESKGPMFDQLGKDSVVIIKGLADGLKFVAPFIKPVAAGLGVFAMHFAGLKVIAGGKWLFGAIKALWSLKWLAGGVPLAIGAVIAGIAAFGFEVYRYMTGGTKAISGFSKQFPALSHAIVWVGNKFKELWPLVQEVGAEFVKFGAQLWETFGPAVKWVFGNIVVPWLTWGIKKFIELGEIILQAAKFWLPVLTATVGDLGAGFKVCWERIQDTWAVLKDMWNWFTTSGFAQGITGFFERLKNAFSGGGVGGGSNALMDPNFPLSNVNAAKLVRNAYNVFTGSKRCFAGVAEAYQKTFKDYGNLSGVPAYLAADQLARDKRFVEVKVTKAMLDDPEIMKRLYGTIAVYDTKSGFHPTYGHIEVWDTLRRKALYGNGADNLNRTEQNFQHGRFFVPVDPGSQTMQGPAGVGGGGGINQTNYFDLRGNPNPGANRNAARQGASEAVKQMERSARSTNQTVIAQ